MVVAEIAFIQPQPELAFGRDREVPLCLDTNHFIAQFGDERASRAITEWLARVGFGNTAWAGLPEWAEVDSPAGADGDSLPGFHLHAGISPGFSSRDLNAFVGHNHPTTGRWFGGVHG